MIHYLVTDTCINYSYSVMSVKQRLSLVDKVIVTDLRNSTKYIFSILKWTCKKGYYKALLMPLFSQYPQNINMYLPKESVQSEKLKSS